MVSIGGSPEQGWEDAFVEVESLVEIVTGEELIDLVRILEVKR